MPSNPQQNPFSFPCIVSGERNIAIMTDEFSMKQNVHLYDRLARIVVALAIGGLYLAGQISGVVAVILGIVAVVFVATGFAGFCPVYHLLKLSTKKEKKVSAA
jgi:hypothetical protein